MRTGTFNKATTTNGAGASLVCPHCGSNMLKKLQEKKYKCLNYNCSKEFTVK